MATTRTRIYYRGDGVTTDFSIPFDYLAKRFVQVLVDNILQKGGLEGDPSAVYYFANSTTIRFNKAPATDVEITIKRYTDATDRIVNFKDASVLKADDLNAAQLQTVHIAEEGRDIIDDALTKNSEGNWDARHRRIINLANPIDDQDAVTWGLYRNDQEGITEAVKRAETAAEEAKLAAEEAKKAASEVAENTEIVLEAQKDVTEKHDKVVELANEIISKADEILKRFEELSKEIEEAAKIVLETKDYIEEIVNNNVVQSGIACARSTWVLEEDLPMNTVIRIPHSPVYVVGRKHLFVSYDGVVMSPTHYNEVGEFNTTSTDISFNFDLFAGQEITAWVVALGGGGTDLEIYDELEALRNRVTKTESDITGLKQKDEDLQNQINNLASSETIQQIQQDITALHQKDEALTAKDSEIEQAIENLKSLVGSGTGTDISGRLSALENGLNTANANITELQEANQTIEQAINTLNENDQTLQRKDEELQKAIDELKETSGGLEIAVVENEVTNAPADLKVGGIVLVKIGYTE